jgi:cleavage stimulation factor subunit 2
MLEFPFRFVFYSRSVPVGPPPSAVDLSPESVLATPEGVQSVLGELDHAQLYEIVAKARMLVQQQPDAARQLFAASPALAYSLLHAQSMLGIISVDAVQQVLQTGAPAGRPGAAPPAAMPHVAPVVAAPVVPAEVASLPQDQQALLAQVMQLTEEQIAALPPDQQHQILTLKATLLQQ